MRIIARADMATHAACAAAAALCAGALAFGAGRPALALLAVPALALYAAAAMRRHLRRWRLARAGFPPAWRGILLREIPFYRELDGRGRARFERDVVWFDDEHPIEGVDGVPITDELRVLIAAGAAVLLHGRPEWELPRGHEVLVYPGAFDEDYRCAPRGPLDGQAQRQGPVIVARDAVLRGWRGGAGDGNVVLHELAHLMDMKGEGPNGVPRTMKASSVGPWLDLVRREMRRVEEGRSVLRPYAAENEAEFFATAVEGFFGRPRELRARHPELYAALAEFFHQDPAV